MKRLRRKEPFGKAGLTVAVLALVLAMVGGAYAASNSGGGKATASAKAKRGPRGPKGATGPAGPAGPAGTNGTNGKDGAPGTNGKDGTNGADGKSVIAATENPGANCTEGGSSFEVEGSGTKHYACNGEEGAPGAPGAIHPGETLPSEATETGSWTFSAPATPQCSGTGCSEITLSQSAFLLAPISFPIPLAGALDGAHVHYVEAGGSAPECPGTNAQPKAQKGNLCVYQTFALGVPKTGELANAEVFPASGGPALVGGGPGASRSGAALFLSKEEGGEPLGWGTWAVTAP